ncbi:alpha-amylase family glycosyl hydrolase [Pseudaquabacterium pictum]|uniref:Cyclomaltodextrinase n=1 Tax=Pseudaquabacterium pictum TaxID=2315236 RepID=A0A480AVS6_9BURK|nr:alpha-amylase family glycosyl hydrolase [Rubrivivax pictus]GCL65433.1 cyclomaltodextrinase [Rubrivivax pictus]
MHPDHAPDPADSAVYAAREADWRCGAVIYQVLVDRFAPSADLAAKAHLYPAPKQLMAWSDTPRNGRYLDDARLWSQEIQFWGGDLASTARRLDHVRSLGADVLYLNPIHLAYTNHKYDALDYLQLSPEFGTMDDFRALADATHAHGMKLVLDGVFNHMGRNSPKFRSAEADAASPYRAWFNVGPEFPGGARSWWLAENLPELNLENPAVRDHVYGATDSAVRQWLRAGADGWRLDVAVDIGFRYLAELTAAAHAEKPGSLVVGEIANYPAEWFPHVDAVMHFTLRHILLKLASGQLDGATAMRMIHRMTDDCGIDHMLRSWIYLDNHDTPRLATTLPDAAQRRLAQVLQFTLPGAPNLYYGSEVGMAGGDDPEMRAPMRWDLVDAGHPELDWTRRLIALHQGQRALKVGHLRAITSHRLIGFERHTDRVADTVLVIANPTDETVTETVMTGNSRLMNPFHLLDLLGTAPGPLRVECGMVALTLPPKGVVVLQPEVRPAGGYSSYKRVP